MFGLSIIDGGWSATGEYKSRASKEASQEFTQCLLISQESIAINNIAKELSSNEPAKAEGITIRYTRPGLYAVARVKGPYEDLSSIAEKLMTEWLPSSSYSYDNEPFLNIYLNNPDTTSPEELLTDFCVPIAGFKQIPVGMLGSFVNM